jgi:hypothetical protein
MSNPESKVSSKYGAPMGRGHSVEPLLGKVRMRLVKLDTGGYDKGGAYWGTGAPLYYAEGDEAGYVYVRGASREYAKDILLELGHITEETRFYR